MDEFETNELTETVPAETKVEDDKVYVNFAPEALKDFTTWGKFVGIVTIIAGVFACLSIVGIPIAILEIIMGLKLFNSCSDMKAYMLTGSDIFNDRAGKNLYSYLKIEMIEIVISIVLVLLGIVLLVVFFTVWLPELIEMLKEAPEFKEFIDNLKEMYPDLPIESLLP